LKEIIMTTLPVIETTFAEYQKFDFFRQGEFWAKLDLHPDPALPPVGIRFPSDWGGNWFVHCQAWIAQALEFCETKVAHA
jgi:hypothetical protein